MKYIEIFIEHVNLKAKQVKLSRIDFRTMRGAIEYLKASEAKRTGKMIEATTQKTKDSIRTYTNGDNTYYLTKRVKL